MCRWLKDILYPLNVLGGRPVKICTYDTTNTPITTIVIPPSFINEKQFVITYAGTSVTVLWRNKIESIGGGLSFKDDQRTFTGGGTATLEILAGAQSGGVVWSIDGESIVFRCKGVTSLTVNGDVLI